MNTGRVLAAIALTATLAGCQTKVAETQEGSVLAQAGRPSGFRYSPAQGVKSGTCRVEITSPELVAFGCPSEEGTFVEYTPERTLEACAAVVAWAEWHDGKAHCSEAADEAGGADGGVVVEAEFELDGNEITAVMRDGKLRVVQTS